MKKAITYEDLLAINTEIQNAKSEARLEALLKKRTEMEQAYQFAEQNRLLSEMDDLFLAIRLLPADIDRARCLEPKTDRKTRSNIMQNDIDRGRGLSQMKINLELFKNQLSAGQRLRVNRYFGRAISAGLMMETDTGYKWSSNIPKVYLGYFINRVLRPANVGRIPNKAIEKLFGTGRIDSAIREAGDLREYDEMRVKIDRLLD